MGFSKEVKAGPATLSINASAGVANVKISVDAAVGGGSMEGAVKAVASAEIDVQEQVIMDAGLELIAAKVPLAAPLIEIIKSMLDPVVAKA